MRKIFEDERVKELAEKAVLKAVLELTREKSKGKPIPHRSSSAISRGVPRDDNSYGRVLIGDLKDLLKNYINDDTEDGLVLKTIILSDYENTKYVGYRANLEKISEIEKIINS